MTDAPAPADPKAPQPDARFPWQGHPNPWHKIGEVIEALESRIAALEPKKTEENAT